ncbi:uncharacterized protein LOC142635547 [Castanea sativa]|uniref:uncharacterized protein LOC142635547 n=1 Tax=Castanea sativa TaxID=21020 RepID=UPI003F64D5ED
MEISFVVAWSIWYNRNQMVNESLCQSLSQIWGIASRLLNAYKEVFKLSPYMQTNSEIGWVRPPPSVFKVNIDGATSADGRKSSVGVMIRDSNGKVTAALCKLLLGHYFAHETEFLALEARILLAQEMDLKQVIFESDALTIVNSIIANENSGEFDYLVQGTLLFCAPSAARKSDI